MEIIVHRRNSLSELNATPQRFGVEVDVRSHGDTLIIHHDPFVPGESFEAWLSTYRHGTLILNVKEEGLEPRLIDLMRRAGFENYFFLDQSFPFLLKYAALASGRSAVRVSEYESVQTALSVAGKVQWAWVDCFARFPLSANQAAELQEAGLKLCIVSPELQGRSAEVEIPRLASMLEEMNICPDAVCTKRSDLWEALVCR
jgi:hypothetical protein